MKGIFGPMFDTVDEALDMADAAIDAMQEGDLPSWRRRYEERAAERNTPERRQNMLLIERLIDEWGDTKMYLYRRLFQLVEPNPYLDMDPRPSVARRLYLKVEDVALATALRVAKLIRRRRGIDSGLAEEAEAWLDAEEPLDDVRDVRDPVLYELIRGPNGQPLHDPERFRRVSRLDGAPLDDEELTFDEVDVPGETTDGGWITGAIKIPPSAAGAPLPFRFDGEEE